MDEAAPPPLLVFANRVIRQLVDHSFGEGVKTEASDLMALRTAFRWCQGSWESVWSGDMTHLELLKTLIKAWGQAKVLKKETPGA